MASSIPQLESLPDEIIISIAKHAEPTAVLALSATSRRFHDICWQTSIFKSLIISCQSNYLQETEPARRKSYVERLSQIPHMTTHRWARYAILEEVLQRLSFGLPLNQSKRNIELLCRRQITLIANTHPLFQDPAYLEQLRRLITHQDAKLYRDTTGHHSGSLGLLHIVLIFNWARATYPNVGFRENTSFDLKRYTELGDHWLQPGAPRTIPDVEIVHLLWGLGDIIYAVRFSRPFQGPFSAPAVVNSIASPSFSDIAFPPRWKLKGSEFSDQDRTPIASLGDKGKKGAKKQMQKGTGDSRGSLYDQIIVPDPIEWLTTGIWTGYYDYSLWRQGPAPRGAGTVRDGPMRNIRFQVVKNMALSVDVRATNCRDNIGPFDLFLEVSKQDGRFRGEKEYRGAGMHSWNWYGMIMPFGIFAAWGPEGTGGYVWLWKEN